jgi:hypothetical protein
MDSKSEQRYYLNELGAHVRALRSLKERVAAALGLDLDA